MNRQFADTSFFIALYQPRDEDHAAAVAQTTRPLKLVTSQWVMAEFAAAFSDPADRGRAAEIIDLLGRHPDQPVIAASAEWFERGMKVYRARADKAWSLVDCISFEIMREWGISEALTGDRHFEQAGFVALLK